MGNISLTDILVKSVANYDIMWIIFDKLYELNVIVC